MTTSTIISCLVDRCSDESSDDEKLFSSSSKSAKKHYYPKGWGKRHTLILLGFLGFANVYAMRVNLSVTIVAMVNRTAVSQKRINHMESDSCPEPVSGNTVVHMKDGEFAWDIQQQGIVLGSFFWGYILTQVPGGRLAELWGARKLFGFGVLAASVFTLLTPLAARTSYSWLIACRIMMGLGEGVTFPAFQAMLAHWAPPAERSTLTTLAFSGSQIGTVITLPLSGLLCQYGGLNGGWPNVFYLFGILGVVWFFFWMYLAADYPSRHPTISPEEKDYIRTSLRESAKKLERQTPVPWRRMLTSAPVWALAVTKMGDGWGFYTLLTEMPTYMANVLHFDLKHNSLVSAIPYLVMWIFSIFCSTVADKMVERRTMSVVRIRKLFNSIGQYGPAIALIGVGFTGCSATWAVVLLTLAVGLSGASYSGYQVNFVDIAPPFAGTLFGITNAMGNVCGFSAPYLVGYLVQGNQTVDQWRLVFLIAAVVYLVTNTIFVLFGSSQVQPWAQSDDGPEQEKVMTKVS